MEEVNKKDNLPRRLYSVQDTGLTLGAIADLTIKILYTRGVMRAQDIGEALKLPFYNVIAKVLEFLGTERLVEVRGEAEFGDKTMRYMVSRYGRMRVQELMERNQYCGPAPVTLQAYNQMVQSQSLLMQTIAPQDLRDALNHLVLSDDVINQLGPAVQSAKSVFIYGNAGNGKTSIGLSLNKLLTDTIWIPYAIDVQGQIIKVYDPLRHQAVLKNSETDAVTAPIRQGLLRRLNSKLEDAETAADLVISEPYDERWVLVRRPLIVAGGELTLNNLDLVYDSTMKYYEAPQQMKANGGIFLLDDLGRQQASAREILNRWTIPLEKRIDYLNLSIGYKFDVPFDVLIVFATNLQPETLVDESFLRRIRHKVHIADPTWDQFHEIFKRECAKHSVPYSESEIQALIDKQYIQANRQPRGVHPRDLLDQLVDIARFRQVPLALSSELLDLACQAYFLREDKQK